MTTQNASFPSEIFGIIDPSAPMSITVFVLSGVGFFLAIFTGVYVVTHAADVAVRLASPATTFLQMVSLAMMNGGVLIAIRRPLTSGWCLGRLWTVQLGMGFLVASSLLKSVRLYRHYRRSRHNPLKLSNEKFMWVLFFVMLAQIGVLMYWTLAETVSGSPASPGVPAGESCVSAGYYAEIATLGVLFVMGALWFGFALATAHLNHRLTEYAWISATVALLCGAVAAFVSHATLLTKTADMFSSRTRLMIESICVFVVTLVMCLGCLYGKLLVPPRDDASAIEEARTFSSSSLGGKKVSSSSIAITKKNKGKRSKEYRRRTSQYSSSAASGLTSHPSALTIRAYDEEDEDEEE